MVNKIFETIIVFLAILIISLLFVDSYVSKNKIEDDSISEEKMIAIANDVKRVESKLENSEESIEDTEEVSEEEKVEEENVEADNNSNIVYDGLTLDELAARLDRAFNNELKGKGYLYASYSLSKGVDPYLAAAISLEETGCKWNCSSLVKNCHNVGGMKGSGCGEYGYFSDLDTGIRAFIDNIYKNYVLYGLTTADTMNPKYAENPLWARNVNAYINRIKNN